MNNRYDLTLIRNTLITEDGKEVTTYGVSYTQKNRTITVRHLSTKKNEVDFFINSLLSSDGSISLIDDLLEDFIS